jgi:hypothetical protein
MASRVSSRPSFQSSSPASPLSWHGLVHPEEWLEPYDEALNDASPAELDTWHRRTLEQLEEGLGELSRYHFEFHAGRPYWARGLREGLEGAGATTSYPMEGKSLGEQLAAYARGPARTNSETRPRVIANPARAREAARRLWGAWTSTGIFGQRVMPETTLPTGVERGSREHACFITLTVAIDYMRDAAALWTAARATFDDSTTQWVFSPDAVERASRSELTAALTRHGVAKRREQDVGIWGQVARSLVHRFGGDPLAIAERCGHRAPAMLDEIRRHDDRGGFPYLRGPKIGPLWIRMLADEVRVPLQDLDRVPIPVDVQVAYATWACGALSGSYDGTAGDLTPQVAAVWRDACEGEPFYSLQLDQALWLQGRDGCSHRTPASGCPREAECVLSGLCVAGGIRVRNGWLTAETRLTEPPVPKPKPSSTPPAGGVWSRVVAHAGQDGFSTTTGKPVRYTVAGETIVVEGRTGARIPRADIELAATRIPLRSLADVPEECWGRSYIYAILTDARIAAG